MHNSTPAGLAEEAFLLPAFEGRACVALQLCCCVRREGESWKDERHTVGAAGLALAFEAVADVDLKGLGGGSLKADKAALAAAVHGGLCNCVWDCGGELDRLSRSRTCSVRVPHDYMVKISDHGLESGGLRMLWSVMS